MKLVRDLLDKQLRDAHDVRIGRVDGLILDCSKGQPRVSAIETGIVPLARRSWLGFLARRISGAQEPGFRIPMSKMTKTGLNVRVDISKAELSLHAHHKSLQRRILDYLPGGRAHGKE